MEPFRRRTGDGRLRRIRGSVGGNRRTDRTTSAAAPDETYHGGHEDRVDQKCADAEHDAAGHFRCPATGRQERKRKGGGERARAPAEGDPVERRREEEKTRYDHHELNLRGRKRLLRPPRVV